MINLVTDFRNKSSKKVKKVARPSIEVEPSCKKAPRLRRDFSFHFELCGRFVCAESGGKRVLE